MVRVKSGANIRVQPGKRGKQAKMSQIEVFLLDISALELGWWTTIVVRAFIVSI
ncbi:15623_t:CDS:2 [Funneliformis caledonium]|uniref:15623_t:CDS:1 n=1 Tax=Funneliformis caledonium TaxID=1117310 RepID=A0A9N9AMG9_9GLOM|nr:15623_t:CDS:2 [Funneliformis caledonium]